MIVLGVVLAAACARAPQAQGRRERPTVVRPGITVLLEDSIALIAGKRIALLTNQTGVDATGASDADLLRRDARARRANVTLVRLFSPEHGIRGTADAENLPDEVDAATGLTVHSLYRNGTVPPPDSLLRDLDALVFDLQDIGTRTWTYVGLMVYAMRAAARANIPMLVLDRPNPLSGRTEGPLLDAALANPDDPSPERRGTAYALYPAPLRHGMTMGELARLFAGELQIPVQLHVMPVDGWRRSMRWEETGLPWIVPSPAMVTTTSALLYPALVAFERTNVSVGRGTDRPFQRFGAPWLNADSVAALLEDRRLGGVRFIAEAVTPQRPTDGKFGGRRIPSVRIEVDRPERVQAARIGAAVLWALGRVHADSLRVTARGFDERFGSAQAREALLAGSDPDEVIDRVLPDVVAFEQAMRKYQLYR